MARHGLQPGGCAFPVASGKASAADSGRDRASCGTESGLAADHRSPMTVVVKPAQFSLLTIVIPARDEEGCIAATVEHLHLEMRLAGIPHQIVVVDDGSSDGTWRILFDLQNRIPELTPLRNEGLHGF